MGTMSLLNQAAVEALCSATYLENYLDTMENLPDDLQRSVSLLRELDSQTTDHLRDMKQYQESYLNELDGQTKKKSLIQIQRALVKCQQLGDEKLQIVAQIADFIETRTRQLEQDLENLDPGSTLSGKKSVEDSPPPAPPPKATMTGHTKTPSTTVPVSTAKPLATTPTAPTVKQEEKPEKQPIKRQRRQRQRMDSTSKEDKKEEDKDKPKKKKKRKTKKEKDGDKSPHIEPIDPDEPTYCSCNQVSYGEMIGCDNESCEIEWFHFNCVNLSNKPKGKWYCPNCRGDRPNVPKRQDK